MDAVLLGLRVVLSLGAVLALMVLVQRRVARGGGRRRPGDLTVVARQGVGGKAQVVLLDTGGQRFLLGVTEQQVSVLHTSDAPAAEFATALAAADAETADGEPAGTTTTSLAPVPPGGPDPHGRVAGSLLDVDTWRTALRVVTGRRDAA